MAEETAPSKIEPTLTSIKDAPSIAAVPDTPIEAVKPAEAAPTVEAPAKIEPIIAEAPKLAAPVEVSKPAAPIEAPKPAVVEVKPIPVLPRAPQLGAEPAAKTGAQAARRPVGAPEVKPVKAATPSQGSGRLALLAASIVLAAGLGTGGGWYAAMKAGNAASATHAARETNEEIRSLKEAVAQLRTTAKTLNENLAGLKLSVGNSTAQVAKMAEAVERIEHTQEQRRAAAAVSPAAETTGSITQRQQQQPQVPMVLGAPPSTLQHPTVQGWTLRRVYDGVALIEGRAGVVEVEPGMTLPGLGRIEDIRRQDGRWVVLTSKGLIVSASR